MGLSTVVFRESSCVQTWANSPRLTRTSSESAIRRHRFELRNSRYIELFSGAFGNWTKSLIAIAQALGLDGWINRHLKRPGRSLIQGEDDPPLVGIATMTANRHLTSTLLT